MRAQDLRAQQSPLGVAEDPKALPARIVGQENDSIAPRPMRNRADRQRHGGWVRVRHCQEFGAPTPHTQASGTFWVEEGIDENRSSEAIKSAILSQEWTLRYPPFWMGTEDALNRAIQKRACSIRLKR